MQVRVLSWWPILEGEPVRSAGAALNTDGAARHGLRALPPSANPESEPARWPAPVGNGLGAPALRIRTAAFHHGESTGRARRHGFETRWHREV
jgi:hypothetical protein